MGVAQSHDDDGAPPPSQQPSNNIYGRRGRSSTTTTTTMTTTTTTTTTLRPLGNRPGHHGTTNGMTYEPSNPMSNLGYEPTLQRVEARDPIQHSGIVTNVVNVDKNSLRLIGIQGEEGKYLLEFEFDAQVDGFITVYYCAKQIIHRSSNNENDNDGESPIIKLSYRSKKQLLNDDGSIRISGKTPFTCSTQRQLYRQNIDKALNLNDFSHDELYGVDEEERYPIVIRLETLYDNNNNNNNNNDNKKEGQVQSQTTFATLIPPSSKSTVKKNSNNNNNNCNNELELKVLAQQVLVNGTIYKIVELYGIGGRDVTATLNEENESYHVDSNDECVVCLTEPCTIVVEPCNHLCLCEDCATTLGSMQDRNMRKCPVCRSELVRLLPLVPPPPPPPPLPPPTTTTTTTTTSSSNSKSSSTSQQTTSTNNNNNNNRTMNKNNIQQQRNQLTTHQQQRRKNNNQIDDTDEEETDSGIGTSMTTNSGRRVGSGMGSRPSQAGPASSAGHVMNSSSS